MDLCYICHVSLAPGCGRRRLSGSVLDFLRVQVLEECFLCKECFRKAQRGYNRQATAHNILSDLRQLRQSRVHSEENTVTANRCMHSNYIEDIYPTSEISTPSGISYTVGLKINFPFRLRFTTVFISTRC